MSSADEIKRRSAARLRFAEQAMEADSAKYKDALRIGSDRPAPEPTTEFSSLPNRTERPGWAPNR
jgi:hypothetical protein